jgi:hypothetical protein
MSISGPQGGSQSRGRGGGGNVGKIVGLGSCFEVKSPDEKPGLSLLSSHYALRVRDGRCICHTFSGNRHSLKNVVSL